MLGSAAQHTTCWGVQQGTQRVGHGSTTHNVLGTAVRTQRGRRRSTIHDVPQAAVRHATCWAVVRHTPEWALQYGAQHVRHCSTPRPTDPPTHPPTEAPTDLPNSRTPHRHHHPQGTAYTNRRSSHSSSTSHASAGLTSSHHKFLGHQAQTPGLPGPQIDAALHCVPPSRLRRSSGIPGPQTFPLLLQSEHSAQRTAQLCRNTPAEPHLGMNGWSITMQHFTWFCEVHLVHLLVPCSRSSRSGGSVHCTLWARHFLWATSAVPPPAQCAAGGCCPSMTRWFRAALRTVPATFSKKGFHDRPHAQYQGFGGPKICTSAQSPRHTDHCEGHVTGDRHALMCGKSSQVNSSVRSEVLAGETPCTTCCHPASPGFVVHCMMFVNGPEAAFGPGVLILPEGSCGRELNRQHNPSCRTQQQAIGRRGGCFQKAGQYATGIQRRILCMTCFGQAQC